MAGWLYLLFGVISSVAIWPISKWCMENNGDEKALGFWNTLIVAIGSFIILIVMNIDFFVLPIIISASIVSIAYSIGFLIIMMYCLKIGPSGLTMTINNSAMIFGILYSITFLKPHIPGVLVIIGIIGVISAITIIGFAKNNHNKKHYDYSKWYKLVVIGGIFSGISFSNQAYMGYAHPGVMNTVIFLFWANILSALIIFAIAAYKGKTVLKKKEFAAGVGNAFFNFTGLICTLASISIFGSELTFPITICLPIVIMLFAGRYLYGEKFDKLSLSGAAVAVISILLITLG